MFEIKLTSKTDKIKLYVRNSANNKYIVYLLAYFISRIFYIGNNTV